MCTRVVLNMNLLNFFNAIVIYASALAAVLSMPSALEASELSKTRDCTVIELRPEIDPNLTNQENLERLTQQFFQSVNTVQHCDPPDEALSAGDSEGGGAAVSSDLAGTEAATEGPNGEDNQPAEDAGLSAIQSEISEALQASGQISAAKNTKRQDGNNGAFPNDIPPADNDSVFEAQIRAAAESEPDPDVKKNLWNEYRKYKGISIQE